MAGVTKLSITETDRRNISVTGGPGVVPVTASQSIDRTRNYRYGTSGAGKAADALYVLVTLSGTTPQSLDLRGGSVLNMCGDTVNWQSLIELELKNTGDASVVLTGNLAVAIGVASGGMTIKAGETFRKLAEGAAVLATVAAASTDVLTLTPAADTTVLVYALGMPV